MKHYDRRDCQLVGLVALFGGTVSADAGMLEEFSDDRGELTDTINRCFEKGALSQVQTGDDDFVIQLGP